MRKALVFTSVVVLLCLSAAALADVVVLKDGTIHRGEIIYKDAQIVIVKTDTGEVLKLSREDIIWITHGPEEEGAAVRQPGGLGLDEAIARLADNIKAQLKASGATAVAVAPFWGPGDGVVALDDTLAQRIAQALGSQPYRVIRPATVQRVLNALRLERSSLTDGRLTGRLANILGAGSTVVGRITAVAPEVLTVRVVLVDAATGKTLGETAVLIAKDDKVRELLGEKAKPQPKPKQVETTAQMQSAVASKFAPAFPLRAFYQKYVANKPGAKFEGDRARWTLESGNGAVVTAGGRVIVASTKKLTEEGQALALERDLSGIFVNLSSMVDGYKSGEIHKDVEFDSVYYAHRPGIFHRFIVRERTDLTRRSWTLKKNDNEILHAKIGLVIDGSWAKLSLGRAYVVSFGRWTTRSATTAAQGPDDVSVKITPYGWIQWYVGLVDVVTEPSLNPPEIVGWGSTVIEYRTNELIEHLQLTARTAPSVLEEEEAPPKRRPRVHTFDLP